MVPQDHRYELMLTAEGQTNRLAAATTADSVWAMALLVGLVRLGGRPPLELPVDLVGRRVAPLAHSEARPFGELIALVRIQTIGPARRRSDGTEQGLIARPRHLARTAVGHGSPAVAFSRPLR